MRFIYNAILNYINPKTIKIPIFYAVKKCKRLRVKLHFLLFQQKI